MVEPVPNSADEQRATLEYKRMVASEQIDILKAIRNRDGLTQTQITKLDTVIPKGEAYLTNLQNRINQLEAQAVNEEIENAIKRVQELMAQ